MTFSGKGLALAALQFVLVACPFAKFQADRARYPRVWVNTQSFDPDLPIRGRYFAMRLIVEPLSAAGTKVPSYFAARLFVKDGHLIAEEAPKESSSEVLIEVGGRRGTDAILQQPILFFLPEDASKVGDLMKAARSGELWAEVTVPESGMPRPIRLGIKHGESFTPIEAR